MKLLEGYVKNRTKEASLAAMMIALYFVTKPYKLQVVPGVMALDLSGTIILTSASIFSWPYTLVFSFMHLYMGSSPFAVISWLVATNTVFFLSKMVKKEWRQYTPIFGQITGFPAMGLVLHLAGVMNFRVYAVTMPLPILVASLGTFIGGLFVWKLLRRFNILDEMDSG